MKFLADGFDVWVFNRDRDEVDYLLLQASKAKADKWFGGAQFWQIPSDFVGEDHVVQAIQRDLDLHGLKPSGIWAAEHTYTIYNRRYEAIVHIAVFVAEVASREVQLTDGHADHAWLDAQAAADRVTFKGLREGLSSVREYITETKVAYPELRLL